MVTNRLCAHFRIAFRQFRRDHWPLRRRGCAHCEHLQRRLRDLERVNAELEMKANTDPLTGLFNRRALCDRFAIAYGTIVRGMRAPTDAQPESRKPTKISALMIDIDHFKSINDQFGHPVGDRVLARVASFIQEYFGAQRPSDSICRWGGEEFLVILPQSDVDHAYEEAVQLVTALGMANILEGNTVTVSIGVADVEADLTQTPPSMLDRLQIRADAALYRAKKPDPLGHGDHPGRTRAMQYSPDMGD